MKCDYRFVTAATGFVSVTTETSFPSSLERPFYNSAIQPNTSQYMYIYIWITYPTSAEFSSLDLTFDDITCFLFRSLFQIFQMIFNDVIYSYLAWIKPCLYIYIYLWNYFDLSQKMANTCVKTKSIISTTMSVKPNQGIKELNNESNWSIISEDKFLVAEWTQWFSRVTSPVIVPSVQNYRETREHVTEFKA
jgi:hypothetical protein